MVTSALLDSGASHNFISTAQLDVLSQGHCLWRKATPLHVTLADASTVLSSSIATLPIVFKDFATPMDVEFRVVP